LTTAFAPANFLYTDTYGIAPYSTTLTVRYLTGGGLSSNISAGVLNKIASTSNIKFQSANLDGTLSTYVLNSVTVLNPVAAIGGKGGDTYEEIRQKSLLTFPTQLRSVTADDYLVRALSMPPEFGSIAKAYIEPEKLSNLLPGETPSVLDLYILTYDINKKLIGSSTALKQNLKTYISQYRIINDSIKIRDAFVINIGVDFDITVQRDYNNNDVVTNCILSLQNYFDINKWTINQPISISDIISNLVKVKGVQSVVKIDIVNKQDSTGNTYSQYGYDIAGATKNGNVYPSLDPSIFEVRYPDVDIQGRVVIG
jgi:hypothetical protein